MDFKELVTEDRRLAVLKFLAQTPGYECNEALMQSALDSIGHNVSRDAVLTDFAWLAEQGLVTVAEVIGLTVATITQRGMDVAAGRASVPGVKKPSPGRG